MSSGGPRRRRPRRTGAEAGRRPPTREGGSLLYLGGTWGADVIVAGSDLDDLF